MIDKTVDPSLGQGKGLATLALEALQQRKRRAVSVATATKQAKRPRIEEHCIDVRSFMEKVVLINDMELAEPFPEIKWVSDDDESEASAACTHHGDRVHRIVSQETPQALKRSKSLRSGLYTLIDRWIEDSGDR